MDKGPQATALIEEKFNVVSMLLDDEYILVHLDTAAPGLSVPSNLLTQPTLTLKLSRLFRGTLIVSKQNISAELLFDEDYFTCILPWEAIWGVTTPKGVGRIWSECIPVAVTQKSETAPHSNSPMLASVPPLTDSDSSSPAPAKTAKARPMLRRVK